MAFRRASRRSMAQIPTSSMADIAFLLLIFFLVTTVFDEEKGLSIVLPAGEIDISPLNVLHLIVRPDGGVEVRRGESVQTRLVAASAIETIWRMESAGNALLVAAVRTHPDSPYGNMIAVLDALQMAGATRISLQLGER